MLRILVGCLALSMGSYATAGFSIEGSPAVSSERGGMGSYQPLKQEARATFRTSDSEMKPRQAKYQDAELLVDLAYRAVTQKGSGHAEQVDGFADDVPFPTAMSMILPTGWQLYKAKGLKQNDVPEVVSYLGGRRWPEVLGHLGERYALQFHVDWYDRTVVMAKGRQGATHQAARIRVIAEPAPAKPARHNDASKAAQLAGSTTKSFAAKPSAAVQGTTTPASSDGKSKLPRPVLKEGAAASTNTATSIASLAKAKPMQKPVEPAKAVVFSMKVKAGTLHDNVVRLSREQGWNAPSWTIDGDFRIPADYSIQARGFPEAMVKLLVLHPIEADVNTAQRKIFVIKEIR
ncbi:hypothetical protein VQ574_21290 (plasmid) [Stutzerimonas frequens]|uniref:hypothetical protein n=1 Tax=Stutzerimonas frequens TaxID=2968969 RepID=UPI002DBA2499|nr:hypothetical protein [Stutzerimonas frequens]WRW29261.1 hypothetical protein VQ574_21290 [Stutzerimonas frequens]